MEQILGSYKISKKQPATAQHPMETVKLSKEQEEKAQRLMKKAAEFENDVDGLRTTEGLRGFFS